MTESLKKIVNQSLNQFPQPKILTSISELGTDAVNKSFEFNSQSGQSQDNEELLRMEIKQLKRQNAFLKGKIQQFKKGNLPQKPQLLKRQSLNYINILKKRPDSKQPSHQNSLTFILKEIQSILKSLASLHRLQTDQTLWPIDDFNLRKQNQQQTARLKIDKQYKCKLQKRLEMIPLSNQQTRYGSLLEIFSEFYQLKNEEEITMKQKIEKYIQKTIQISRRLIENANTKAHEKTLRSSCIYSTNTPNIDTSIIYHEISSNDSIFQQKTKKEHNPEKHELSYSTMDAQYAHRQID